MCQLLFTVGLLMTCLRWTSAAAVPGPVYVAVDGIAVLHPGSEHTGDIKTVTWKYGADKAAELDRSVTICYQQFKGRCELNTMTGEMMINHLTLSDSGFYSAEINGIEVNTVQLWVMYRVSKPSVFTWCDVKKTYCLLTCEGTSSIPESLQYRWNEENDWSHSVKVLTITKENKEPEFSCELKNTVSSSRSDPVQNPFITAPVSKPSVFTWCDPTKTYCLLTCEGTTSEPESLQYRWKEENDWSHSMKVLKITKENKEPEFSCELKNPVSSSRSDPVQNPFITVGTVYVKVDGTAVLHPGSAVTGNIKPVTWKHGADKAAEWSGRVSVCYRQFEGRCDLNIITGELTIKHLTLSDNGFYSAEINGYEVNTVQLQVMSPVPKPLVFTWCDPPKTYCLLTCEGTSSVPESLQYRWNEENDWSHSMKVLTITKENKEPEFSCELKNPVSSSRSDPVQNPFITGSLLWIIAVVLVILLIVIVAVVLYYKRKHICQKEADAEKNEEIKLDQQKQSVQPAASGPEADAEKIEEIKLDQQKQRVQPPTSGPEGTVYEEVDGTAVLHPGSEHTGDIMTVKWKHNGITAAEWYGKNVSFSRQFEGRCELNTRTGELTINHLTLSHSGSYSVDINGKENNTVQLQVMSKKTAAGEAGDEEEPGETTELLSQSGGVQQESRGGGVQQESRGGGVQQESRGDGVQQESRGGGVQQESRGGGVQQESIDGGVHQESRGGGVQQESIDGGVQQESRGGGVQQESRGDVNDPPDVSSVVTSSSGSSADVHHDSAQSPGADGSSASSPDSGDEGTVYEEVDGSAVLHPGSAHTGDITSIMWKHNGDTVAELYGGEVFFHEQFEGRCELNTTTGKLTIKHLTLSDSGSYSVKINGQLINAFQLQVTSPD